MTTLQSEVYARVIDNESSLYQDISIRLLPTNSILRLIKKDVAFQTKYIIELDNAQKLCTISSDAEGSSVLGEVVLAINLVLKQVALSRRLLYRYSETRIIWGDAPVTKDVDSYRNVEILQTTKPSRSSATNNSITAEESVSSTDIADISFKAQPIELEEERVLRIFDLVHQLDKGPLQLASTRELHNLGKSLMDYDKAMNNPELSEIFNSLFMALEKAINYQKEVRGEEFDNVTAVLTNSLNDEVKNLRQAYDRFKHPAKTLGQVSKTEGYTRKLPELIRTLRPITEKAIVSRLKLITSNP